MTEEQAVIDSILRRPKTAVEVLSQLLELAEAGKLDYQEMFSHVPQQLLSGHLPAEFIPTGPREITVVFRVLEE